MKNQQFNHLLLVIKTNLPYKAKFLMAVPTGFEPVFFCVTGRRVRPLH